MMRFCNLMLSATLACCAAAAQAGTTLKSANVPKISNGGTGFIGVTESAGMPRQAVRWNDSDTSSIPVRAGEATTLVKGRLNVDPYAPMGSDGMGATRAQVTGELRRMGSSREDLSNARDLVSRNPAWGTPD